MKDYVVRAKGSSFFIRLKVTCNTIVIERFTDLINLTTG